MTINTMIVAIVGMVVTGTVAMDMVGMVMEGVVTNTMVAKEDSQPGVNSPMDTETIFKTRTTSMVIVISTASSHMEAEEVLTQITHLYPGTTDETKQARQIKVCLGLQQYLFFRKLNRN